MIQLTDKIFCVEVPEFSKKHHISATMKVATSNDQSIFFKHQDEDELDEWTFIELPPGTWCFLFTSESVSEEDARKVVPSLPCGRKKLYKGVRGGNEVWLQSALESLRALLKSKGWEGNVAVVERVS